MVQVSVIIPTHRRPEFLRRAIESVLGQTYEDFELLVVDDASSDHTTDVVKSFSDTRVQYWCNDTNRGGAATRNRGISLAQAAYLAFLDDDDEWLPQKLEMQVALLESCPEKVGGVYSGCERIASASGKSLGVMHPTKRGDLSYELLLSNPLAGTSGILLKKACFEKAGLFDERLPSYQDYDLWIRISKHFHFEYVDKVLYKYYVHDRKIWANPQVLNIGLDLMIDKHCTNDLAVRKNFSAQYLLLGVMYCHKGDMVRGRKACWKALKLYPFEIRNYYNLMLSFLGAENFTNLKGIGKSIS